VCRRSTLFPTDVLRGAPRRARRPGRSARGTRQAGAFTLVELLVVVGIVTVLIALLMPALGKVRKHAWEVKCAANLRSIGHALTMYTQQYGSYPGCTYGYGPTVVVWPTRLRPFLGGERGVFNCPARPPESEWSATFDYGPGTMNAQSVHTRYGYDVGEVLLITGQHYSYDYNANGCFMTGSMPTERQLGLGGRLEPERPESRLIEMKASRVKNSSEMIAVADTVEVGFCQGLTGYGGAEHDVPGTIHRGGANVLFCDGHVQWYAQTDLVARGTPQQGPSQAAVRNRRLWNNTNSPFAE